MAEPDLHRDGHGLPVVIPVAQKWGGLAEATSATYSLPLTQINQAGSYSVVVSNPAGSITSAPPAVLTVNTLAAQGTVVAWGDNSFGQTTVPVAAQSGVTAIAAGGNHTVALKDDGMVMVWGSNEFGQTTVPVAAQSGVMAIAAGAHHTLALKNDGTMVAWGFNLLGEVTGTPTAEYPYSATASPVTLGGQVLSGVTAIAAGYTHTVALLGSGSAMPSLTSRSSRNELILSWPVDAVGFTLQSTLNLTPPAIWVDSDKSPEVTGAQFAVKQTINGSAQFYRLRKP